MSKKVKVRLCSTDISDATLIWQFAAGFLKAVFKAPTHTARWNKRFSPVFIAFYGIYCGNLRCLYTIADIWVISLDFRIQLDYGMNVIDLLPNLKID